VSMYLRPSIETLNSPSPPFTKSICTSGSFLSELPHGQLSLFCGHGEAQQSYQQKKCLLHISSSQILQVSPSLIRLIMLHVYGRKSGRKSITKSEHFVSSDSKALLRSRFPDYLLSMRAPRPFATLHNADSFTRAGTNAPISRKLR
jgi:hypothetical protein